MNFSQAIKSSLIEKYATFKGEHVEQSGGILICS